jgi:hypothetical protein
MLKWMLVGALASSAGCTYIAATPSVQGKAYVVRNEYVSSSYWNCDATSGEPVCYQTKKQFTKQPVEK